MHHYLGRDDQGEKMLNSLALRDLEWFLKPNFEHKITRYPLTDLGIDKNGVLHVAIAVAGFSKDDIELEMKGNQLHIRGNKVKDVQESDIEWMQRHISSNTFERIIAMQENFVGGDVNASMTDGILSITVQPKEQLKKLISIQ